ncbi:unnamed protein product [Lactuca saligna]|uniref:Uncharacterized protein n=1 Tax=Lactuca saligna TaxID=75948 RepID=A0AA35YXJ4_LACSI|nr:unnamed protein product [Lactuca saligna]
MQSSEHEEVDPIHDEELVTSLVPLPYWLGSGIKHIRKPSLKYNLICRWIEKKSLHWLPGIQIIVANPNQYYPFHDGWEQNHPQDFKRMEAQRTQDKEASRSDHHKIQYAYDFMITHDIQRLETEGHIRAALARVISINERSGGLEWRVMVVVELIQEILDVLSHNSA